MIWRVLSLGGTAEIGIAKGKKHEEEHNNGRYEV